MLQVCHIQVTRQEKKKRDWILCLARTNDVPVYVKIYLLKKSDKDSFKKKNQWQLRELKILDGVGQDSPEFKLDLDERYTWEAVNPDAKIDFLKKVQNLCERYNVGRKTKYLNLNFGLDSSARGQGVGDDDTDRDEAEEGGYQAISEKETADLRALMTGDISE